MDMQSSTPVESQPVTVQRQPRPFGEIPSLWLQLPHMDQSFFAGEMAHTSPLNTFLAVMIYAGVATIALILVALLRPIAGTGQESSAVRTATLLIGCFALFITPISFYLNTALNYASARLFGGKGGFNDQAYLASLFVVPMGFVSSLLTCVSLIPVVGPFIEWVVLLIIIVIATVLQYRAIRVVHGLSSGRAAGAVLAPLGLFFGLICLAFLAIGALMLSGPVIGNVFSSINQSLMTPAP